MARRGFGTALCGGALALLMAAGLAGCKSMKGGAQDAAGKPTAAEAAAFVQGAEEQLKVLAVKAQRAQWVQSNFITDDTEKIAADANKELIAASMEPGQGGHALRRAWRCPTTCAASSSC